MTRKRLDKTVWVPAPELGGWEILVRYLPLGELERMVRRASESTWDRRAGRAVDNINPERLIKEYAGVILDWRGLNREMYARLIPIDPEDYPEVIPCEEEYKLELLREAYGFSNVIREICTDLSRFQAQELEGQVKN
jgi:hypothetical protein